jgi:hypothetical protein
MTAYIHKKDLDNALKGMDYPKFFLVAHDGNFPHHSWVTRGLSGYLYTAPGKINLKSYIYSSLDDIGFICLEGDISLYPAFLKSTPAEHPFNRGDLYWSSVPGNSPSKVFIAKEFDPKNYPNDKDLFFEDVHRGIDDIIKLQSKLPKLMKPEYADAYSSYLDCLAKVCSKIPSKKGVWW